MKNLSLILNGVLGVALVVLYYLHFSSTKPTEKITEEIEVVEVVGVIDQGDGQFSKIACINIDSMQANYKLFEEITEKFKKKQQQYEREINSESVAFQKKIKEFQEKAPTMSQFEGQLKQQELAEEEQRIYKQQESYTIKLTNEQAKLNESFEATVKKYIQEYNKDANYDIIIGKSALGSRVLDYKKEIDITDFVLKGLNKEYEEKNKKKDK